MKTDLMLKKYKVSTDYGTMNMKEIRSFFGSKMMDIEDSIIIDNISISYMQYYSDVNTTMNGYQYYDLDKLGLSSETNFSRNLTDIKSDNHSINLNNQSIFQLQTNTRWDFVVNIKNILKEYLFLKIKERRTFRCIKLEYLKSLDINLSIYEYIDKNILNRYTYDGVDFYVEYFDLYENKYYYKDYTTYTPKFDVNVYVDQNKIQNINIEPRDYLENLKDLNLTYYQIKEAERYKFNYYFNVKYKKI